jgi:antitoxin MazE
MHENAKTTAIERVLATQSDDVSWTRNRRILLALDQVQIWRAATPWIYYSEDVYPEVELMQVSRWGNSLAIRLPAAVVEALGLKEGDSIEIHAAGKRIFEIDKIPGTRELLARLRKFRGRLPKDFKFDRLEANERR